MKIGIDFDNTIVSYDSLFYKVAVEGGLVPEDLPRTKLAVREHLKGTGREDVWTEMQGYVYGARLLEAEAFPGVLEFFAWARGAGLDVLIISHKTRHPYIGPSYDLHAIAKEWVDKHLTDGRTPYVPHERVFFELTKQEKIKRVAACGCDYFIDDLPEILLAPDFPASTTPVLFAPEGNAEAAIKLSFGGWEQIKNFINEQHSNTCNCCQNSPQASSRRKPGSISRPCRGDQGGDERTGYNRRQNAREEDGRWIPAFAGMTLGEKAGLSLRSDACGNPFMVLTDATQAVQALWMSLDGSIGGVTLQPCPVSGNNRVFFADAPGKERVVAKFYFPPQAGETDRLSAEWRFLQHAFRACPDFVPKPLACDPKARLALYGYIDGVKLASEQIGEDHVIAAADFIKAINNNRQHIDLPEAREACFSLTAHIALIDQRLKRLESIRAEDVEAVEMVRAMKAFWQERSRQILEQAKKLWISSDDPIPDDERILSPSDFGFHNALVRSDGSLAFIDFEYAGSDDIAKLASDFFYQPGVPVARTFEEPFLAKLLKDMVNPEATRRRIALFRPIFGLKWCLIMLNCFLPDRAGRELFINPKRDAEQRKREQLMKARLAFNNLKREQWPT